MDASIQEKLDQIEAEHGVQILLAVESGSRAWGFASPDSDYDVRFVYWHPQDWYLSVFEQRDVIELPVDAVLDINGWDIRKALRLLWKSNAALLEWLHSSMIYRAHAKRAHLDALAGYAFLPLTVCHHYRALANNAQRAILQTERCSLKKYFYALRAALCCQWIIQHRQAPPVRFSDLLKDSLGEDSLERAHIEQQLVRKTRALEQDKIPRDSLLDHFLTRTLADCETNLPENPARREISRFDEAFRKIIE